MEICRYRILPPALIFMKTITIIGADKVETSPTLHMTGIDVVAQGSEGISASDGYHTFDELYEHRIELFIALCRELSITRKGQLLSVWRSKLHSDGSSFEGWFILGIGTDAGSQITYHLPMSKWDDCAFAETFEKAPEWDGHSSEDVLERLRLL